MPNANVNNEFVRLEPRSIANRYSCTRRSAAAALKAVNNGGGGGGGGALVNADSFVILFLSFPPSTLNESKRAIAKQRYMYELEKNH